LQCSLSGPCPNRTWDQILLSHLRLSSLSVASYDSQGSAIRPKTKSRGPHRDYWLSPSLKRHFTRHRGNANPEWASLPWIRAYVWLLRSMSQYKPSTRM
jgi:hypothetical protein